MAQIFCREMFEARGYDVSTMETRWLSDGHICEFSVKENENTTLIVLQVNKTAHDILSTDVVFEDAKLAMVSSTKINFIETIQLYVRKRQVELTPFQIQNIIILTDKMLPQAQKEIIKSSIKIVHISLSDICSRKLSLHKYQPHMLRKLSVGEKKKFISKNPNYIKQQEQLGCMDILTKYMGFNAGDIIEYKELDSEIGFIPGFIIIVRETKKKIANEKKKTEK